MKSIVFIFALAFSSILSAGELTDLLNGNFRIHNHKIRSISVKCHSALGGKYRVISKLGQLYEFYASGITCLDEQFEREKFERDFVKPYDYIPYPLVYNFDFKPIGIKNKYLLVKVQLYPRKPSTWYDAPKVPYKDENGNYTHKFVYEPLDETDFIDNCNYYQDGNNLDLKGCLAFFDEKLDLYPSTYINKSVE